MAYQRCLKYGIIEELLEGMDVEMCEMCRPDTHALQNKERLKKWKQKYKS